MRRRAVAALLGLAFGVPAATLVAQRAPQRQQQPTFRAGVELVEVDVVVLDPDGRPVRGLTAHDFTIVARRQPQAIATFTEISHHWPEDPDLPVPPREARQDVADNASAQSQRVVFLVIDDINIWIEREALVRDLAHRVVDELGPDASMAVLFTSGRNSVEITQDRGLLHDVIDRFEGAYHRFRVNGICRPDNFQECQMLDQLKLIGRLLGAEDRRRKAIVLITEWNNVDTRGLFDTGQPRGEPVAGGAAYATGGGAEGLASISTSTLSYHEVQLLQMMRAFHRANVALYALDPRGPLTTMAERARESRGAESSFGLRMNDPLSISQESLIEAAEASGGFAITNTDDFEAGLGRLIDDLDNYYLIGFHPPEPIDDDWHAIDVMVKDRPELTVRHRKGYQLGAEADPPENRDRLVQLSAGILPKTGLPIKLFATPVARVGNDARVAVTAEIRVPAERIARPGGRLEDTLTLTALAVDMRRQKVEATAKHVVEVEVPRSRVLPSGDVSYQLVFGMTLRPAPYQLRVSAESARLDESGSVYLTVDVPDVGDERVVIAGPAIALAPGSRAPAGLTLAEDGLLPAGFDPMLERVFSQAETLRVRGEIWRRDARRAATALVAVIGEGGGIVFERDVPVPAARDRNAPATPIDLEIPLATFAPGAYRIVITASGDERQARREVGFAVRAAGLPPARYREMITR